MRRLSRTTMATSTGSFFQRPTETFGSWAFRPTASASFGGDTDNWMWPRHNGDFSLFRVYADKDGKPADYNKDNKPYHPKQFFSINTSGYKEGDFTMVYGFPGYTQEYIASPQLDLDLSHSGSHTHCSTHQEAGSLEGSYGGRPRHLYQIHLQACTALPMAGRNGRARSAALGSTTCQI